MKDTSLYVVPLSSDDESSVSPHTDISDDESPKRLQRSGTFTKLELQEKDRKNSEIIESQKKNFCGDNENQLNQSENFTREKANNDEHTPVVFLVDTVEDVSSQQDEETVMIVDTKEVVDEKRGDIEVQVDNEKDDDDDDKETKSPVNDLFMVGTTSIINSLEPPADSTDFSEDVRSFTATKKKKKKKLTKKAKHHPEENELKEIKPEPEISKYDDDNVVGITIHESDFLLTDGILKPLIEVHVVDQNTGQYLRKQQAGSPGDDSVYITPLQTQVFDLHTHRRITPKWEEQLVLLESPSYIFSLDTVLLFELIDRSGHHKSSSLYNKLGSSSSVQRVAWAFLKLIGANRAENVNKKIRLQLFRPRTEVRLVDNTYKWFKKLDKCRKLPNSLYVTVRNIQRPSPLSPTSKSRVDLQSDGSSLLSNRQERKIEDNAIIDTVLPEHKQWQWNKLPSESCKIPNKKMMSVSAGPDGTLDSKFSPNGLLLAVATHCQVYIYTVAQGTLLHVYNAHSGLIYTITWYEDNNKFLTTSADRTVCVWSLSHTCDPICILPHPCYVYNAMFIQSYIVTCCYDTMLRVWSGELTQELSGHTGYVNAMCYNSTTRMLYSGDSQGVVMAWRANDNSSRYTQEHTLLITGLHGVVINTLLVYGRSCLIVHSQDSVLRMIDASSGTVLQWYRGCVNDSINTGCTLSPCKSLLFSASDDGNVYAWESHSGVLRGVYLNVTRGGPITLHYHPQEHMLLMGGYEIQAYPPVTVLRFSRKDTGKDVGLHLMAETREKEPKSTLAALKKNVPIQHITDANVPPPDKLSNIMLAMDQVLKSVT